MILLDTDILSLFLAENLKVREKVRKAEEDVAITVITKVEIHSCHAQSAALSTNPGVDPGKLG